DECTAIEERAWIQTLGWPSEAFATEGECGVVRTGNCFMERHEFGSAFVREQALQFGPVESRSAGNERPVVEKPCSSINFSVGVKQAAGDDISRERGAGSLEQERGQSKGNRRGIKRGQNAARFAEIRVIEFGNFLQNLSEQFGFAEEREAGCAVG